MFSRGGDLRSIIPFPIPTYTDVWGRRGSYDSRNVLKPDTMERSWLSVRVASWDACLDEKQTTLSELQLITASACPRRDPEVNT